MARWGAAVILVWGTLVLVCIGLGWLRARARDRRVVSDNLKGLGIYTAQMDYMRQLDMELDEATKDVMP